MCSPNNSRKNSLIFRQVTAVHLESLESIVSRERISTGESNLDLHSRDQSHHASSRPEVVIWPTRKEEVIQIVRYANESLIPVTCWGSGSSLEGNPIPISGGIVLDFSQMNRILQIREADFQADVEPGLVYQDLNKELRHKGLFFPPDPGARATIGGMISNNASGTRTVRYGSTRNHILRLSVATANGELIQMGTRASKTSSGYDLINLIVGSEGTLGIVVEATVRLTGYPAESSAAIAAFPSVEASSEAVVEVIRSGLEPASLELMSPECVELINLQRALGLTVSPVLFMEFHGPTKEYLVDVLDSVKEICEEEGCIEFRAGLDREERDRLLSVRHELGEMIIRNHPGRQSLVIDVAVPITAYPEIIALAKEETRKADIPGYIFSHAGDGNLHLFFMVRKEDEKEMAIIDRINQDMVLRALAVGGTATGEHGVGIGKRRFMEIEHGPSLALMRRIKTLFDPKGILNPGKIFI